MIVAKETLSRGICEIESDIIQLSVQKWCIRIINVRNIFDLFCENFILFRFDGCK